MCSLLWGGIYSIRTTSKKEIEETKTDLDNRENRIKKDLKEDIQKTLTGLLKDSISFRESVISSIYGRIEDEIVTQKDIEDLYQNFKNIENRLKELSLSLDVVLDKNMSEEEIE